MRVTEFIEQERSSFINHFSLWLFSAFSLAFLYVKPYL